MKNDIDYSKYDEILNIPYRVTGERKWRWMEGFVRYAKGSEDTGFKELVVLYDPKLEEFITTRHNVEILIIKDVEAKDFKVSATIVHRTNNIVVMGTITCIRLTSNNTFNINLMGLWCYGNISHIVSGNIAIGCLRVPPENIKAIIAPNFLINIIDFPRIASKEGVSIELREPDVDRWTSTT